MIILETNNLTKYYGKNENKIKAVDNINLKIKQGEFVAIIGPSGSGKSTLLSLLAGLDRPSRGKVYIDSEDIYELKDNKLTKFRLKNIGFVYQFYNLIPVLTIKENIILPSLLEKQNYSKQHFNNLIKTLNLKERLNYLPNEISGGQQQRASIARALINKPKILFADEPTGNLDTKNKTKVMKLLKTYNEKYNQTIIIVTHDMSLAKMTKKIIVLEDGKIKEEKRVSK
ncbi:MAG: ABC transporter ATP-binding protein [Bacilli bacterium]|nr:ABC transporter ATP-binding protein [Bacilli bacterium]